MDAFDNMRQKRAREKEFISLPPFSQLLLKNEWLVFVLFTLATHPHFPSSDGSYTQKKRETLWVTHMDNFSLSHSFFLFCTKQVFLSVLVVCCETFDDLFIFFSLARWMLSSLLLQASVWTRSRPTWNAVIGVVCFCNFLFQTHTHRSDMIIVRLLFDDFIRKLIVFDVRQLPIERRWEEFNDTNCLRTTGLCCEKEGN